MGGTGKSPFVLFLANLLSANGHTCSVISRGYKGKADKKTNIVSNKDTILLSPEDSGDEPGMIARKLPGTPVLTGRKRVFPCRYAEQVFESDFLILDDGFQHLSVNRDLDIVLFNSNTLEKLPHVFPAGILRENLKALHRADILIFTNYLPSNSVWVKRFESLLHTKNIFKTTFCIPNPELSIQQIQGPDLFPSSFLAFSGIANPDRFHFSLEKAGIKPADTYVLNDHHQYTQKDIDSIESICRSKNIDGIITTAKDLVKIEKFSFSLPLYCADLLLTVPADLSSYLHSWITKHCLSHE